MSVDAFDSFDLGTAAANCLGFRDAAANSPSTSELTIDDRRTGDRTRIAKAAALFFGGQTGERSCEVSITDITSGGAGIQTQGLAVLPLHFELSLDNFRRKCRLVWRKGNFFGVAFEHQDAPTTSATKLSEAGSDIPGLSFSALNDPAQLTFFDTVGGSSELHSKAIDRKIQIGVAIALALPILIGMSFYIATAFILRAS
jgi:hypothetical protein